jgi:Spy/CpxP family protein refolding chaperone
MKKLVTAVAAVMVMFLSTSAVAQESQKQNVNKENRKKGDRKKDKKHGAKKALKALDLSDAQKASLKTQKESFKKQQKAIKANTTLTEAQKQEKRTDLKASQKAKLESILTAEQKAKLAALKEKKAKKGESKKENKLNKMQTNLGLSTTQVSQIKAQRSSYEEKAKAIKANTTLTKEAKKEQIKTLHAEGKKSLSSILTPEQLKKMEESKKNKHPKHMTK